MKNRVNLATLAVLIALTAVTSGVIVQWYVMENVNSDLDEYYQERRELKAFMEAKEKIEKEFVGEYDAEKLMHGAIEGMVGTLGDQWSHYWTPDSFRTHTEDLGAGIGAELKPAGDNSGMEIAAIEKNSPAAKAQLKIGDVITEIDGKDTKNADDAAQWLKGEEYTDVEITILRDGKEKNYTIMRERITKELLNHKILNSAGYIQIGRFENRVDTEFIDTVDQLISGGVKGLVVDVRNNPGGELKILRPMLNHLLDDNGPRGDGTLISLKYKDGSEETLYSEGKGVETPLVVLVNNDSYSAAEFFAACLQEFNRAEIVGEKTGGKGHAQSTFQLSDGSGILFSTSEYFTPSGKSLAETGMMPDHEIPMTQDEKMLIGSAEPEKDKQLQKALQLLGAIS
ncbi:MAG: S41 family peptidase [Oscillospiraceae bacterium]|nr:S41 family peptidase [Oscillospiraceae bacterium]